MTEKLSLAAARRIALAAQGFADPRPAGPIDVRQMRRVLGRIGLLQIDSVSVLVRAHYLPLFSRLGGYTRTLLDQDAWGRKRQMFEYWAHEASLLPIQLHPLLRWRMARAERLENSGGGLVRFARERRQYIETVFAEIVARGPIAASELEGPKGAGGWWGWSDAKHALEYLFLAGRVTASSRRGFERLYDLPERVLPPAVIAAPTPPEAEAHRALLRLAAGALGVATAADLGDYFRLNTADVKPRLAELVEAGALIPTAVESWTQPAFVAAEARRPRRVAAQALLVPFDPLVWERARTERLFGFRYRLEIYTPAAKRQHGYYVLPFLLGERLVGRVDLKSDRAAGVLLVLAAHAEPYAPPHTATALAEELRVMANWLGLARIEAASRGELAGALVEALARI